VAYHRKIRNKTVTDNSGKNIPNHMKTILSLCDYSGSWSKPYKEQGYNVVRIDLKRGQDVRLLEFPGEVYGVLAAPPCDHFASAGARWWKDKGNSALLEGLSVFDACARIVLFTNPKFWVFENPVGRLKDYIGQPQWIFDPCDYGDPYTKKTCLWGNFNSPPPREKVGPIRAPSGHHSMDQWLRNQGFSLGKSRAALRSVTPEGFSRAFFNANR